MATRRTAVADLATAKGSAVTELVAGADLRKGLAVDYQPRVVQMWESESKRTSLVVAKLSTIDDFLQTSF